MKGIMLITTLSLFGCASVTCEHTYGVINSLRSIDGLSISEELDLPDVCGKTIRFDTESRIDHRKSVEQFVLLMSTNGFLLCDKTPVTLWHSAFSEHDDCDDGKKLILRFFNEAQVGEALIALYRSCGADYVSRVVVDVRFSKNKDQDIANAIRSSCMD